uniref:Uncharacterized protein n=1 Tax=Aegilops tauschii TaxID=37682 RepID=R7W6Y0_AEGTA
MASLARAARLMVLLQIALFVVVSAVIMSGSVCHGAGIGRECFRTAHFILFVVVSSTPSVILLCGVLKAVYKAASCYFTLGNMVGTWLQLEVHFGFALSSHYRRQGSMQCAWNKITNDNILAEADMLPNVG